MIGTTLLHYRIVRALGSGGMGEVYAAQDTKLHRPVALKILPAATAADPERLARFRREAQAIAALNHPHVVTIYSVEDTGGTHFLTMEIVDGRTLAELLPSQGLTLQEFLKIAVPLTDAVSAAHAQGVVHRDLKPSNVMVSSSGRVKVLDFGLAKLRQETLGGVTLSALSTDRLTAPHHVFGTPAYMSPEQAEGQDVDHRTDIFALGIVLYEMATGKRPFTGDSPMTVISSIIKDTPAPVVQRRPDLPADLDRILRRCLAKDPARRYQTALDLKTELEDLPLTASSITPPAIERRRRGPAQLVALLITVLTVIGLSMGWSALKTSRGISVNIAHPVFTQITSAPGAELFPSLSPDAKWVVYAGEGAGNRDIYLQSTSGQKPINLTGESTADDDQPVFSPDGELIAFRSGRDGGGIFIMGRTGDAVRRITRAGFNPAWSPDGKRLAYTTHRMELRPQNSEGKSELWTVNADGTNARRVYEGDATIPHWSPHGVRIAFAQRLGVDRHISLATVAATGGEAVVVARSASSIDWNPIWSPNGEFLYFASDRGGSTNIWLVGIDENSGAQRGEPEPMTTPAPFAAHLSVSANGQHLAFGSINETQNIYRLQFDPAKTERVGDPAHLTTGSRRWSSPDPSPDGQLVVFYSQIQPEGDLYVIKSDGTGLRQLTNDEAIDRVPRWAPDGKSITAFSDRDGKLQLWRIGVDGSELQQLTDGDEHGVHVWAPDGLRLASGLSSRDGTEASPAAIVDLRQQLPVRIAATIKPAPAPLHGFVPNSWSRNGKWIAGQNGYVVEGVSIYSVDTGTYTRVSEVGGWPVWFPDDRHLLVVSRGREFHVIDSVAKTSKMVFSVARDTLGPPRLTRDGKAAYFSRRVTEADIWLVNLQ
jgi:serine/threonine protein kinase